MKKKTIVHITNSNVFSGLERVACEIIESLKDNYNFIYVTKDGPIIEHLKRNKIKYYIIKKMSIKEIKKMVKDLKPNLIHAHDYRASTIASLSIKGIPIISHLHNNWPWIKYLHPYSILYFLSSFNIKQILTVSSVIEKEYIFGRFLKKKITYIKNPLKRENITKFISKNDVKKIYDICCVGRLTEQKNPERFIKIISMLKEKNPNIKCVWVGNGELLEQSKELRDELGLKENIEFVGFKENPYTYMNASKIFILTSKWEGYCLVTLEALTLGLPTITSNILGMNDILNEKCGGVFEKDIDFVNLINKLLNNNEKYQMMSQNAITQSKKLENYNNYMKKIKRFYNKEIN